VTRTSAVREYVLSTHEDLLETVLACADGVAESWDDKMTTDRRCVVEPFERALHRGDVINRLPVVLAGAVDALDESLPAAPVAAPPYLTVTSVGPVLRATLSSARLVITIRVFAVERDPTRYVRARATPTDALHVALKNR
jgi:hypothetical protein